MIPKDFDTAHAAVIDLVNAFNSDLVNYLRPEYNESAVRMDFVDKFFVALGWDVNHEHQRNVYAQEVKVEKVVNVAERVKKADYSFSLAPDFQKVHFFVEAKKPSIPLETPANCFQILRYGYSSAKANLSILTNFKEFIVLDCRYLPDFDTAIQRIHKRYDFTDFLNFEKFAEIYYLFGREAVADGTYERVCSELPKPKGKVKQLKLFADGYKEVDDSFLEMLESFREELAKNFKKRNQSLDSDDLTEAVQRTLDRLVFIRFLEDKLIEPDTILDKFGFKPNAWGQFKAKSREFDKTYNGIIFKYHSVIDDPDFSVDDRVFLDICDKFAGDRTPYHFNYIPIHILGSIYERFLGNVIVATAKQARIEAKPEVRKAGGVFYTPQYIVKYIVENTVGKLLEKKTPEEVAKLRFADIACGSGSFLLGVYEYLLAWHTDYYNKKATAIEAKKAGCIVNEDGTFHLSFEQKSDILVNNVYGVDIDRQAHEVTQLSLFLKLLEEETLATKRKLWDTERKALLPSLGNNIVCGNALVDWDITSGDLFEQFDQDKEKRLNPMSFQSKFPEVMRNEGFDAIVGNPPYRMLQPNNTEQSLLDYLRKKFIAAEFKIELFHLFLQRAILKLRDDGKLGYIVPTTVLNNVYAESLRGWLLENSQVESISVARGRIFAEADVHTSVLIFQKSIAPIEHEILTTTRLNMDFTKNPVYEARSRQSLFSQLSGKIWNVLINNENASLIMRLIRDFACLEDVGTINRGLITGDRKKYFSTEKLTENHVPILAGGDVHRYAVKDPTEFVLFERPKTAGGSWDAEMHLAPHKIVVRQIGEKPTAGIITEPIAVTGNIFTVRAKTLREELYILGLINSRLAEYFWRIMFTDFKDSFPQVTIFSLAQLPIHKIDEENSAERAKQDQIVHAVEQIMDAKAKLATAKNDGERDFLTNKCEKYESDINNAVYSLYSLTPEEIALVEKS